MVVPDTRLLLVKIESRYIDTVWELMETIFTAVYVLEVWLKITVLGWKKYSESPRNMFDFTITWLAVFATLYVYCKCICTSNCKKEFGIAIFPR
jgi:hypothetical protein